MESITPGQEIETVDYPETSNQIGNYLFSVWAAATFIPGFFLLLAGPLFGVLTMGGGFVALPCLLPAYIVIKYMYWYKINVAFIRLAMSVCFFCSVTLAVFFMELVVGLPINFTGVLFAIPVLLCGLIAVWAIKLPKDN